MSRLDELIEKLCPDGAEFLTLQECTQKVKNIKWKSYSGNDKKYIDLSSVDRDLHCIMETQNINSDSAPSRAQQIVQTDDILLGTTRPMLKRYCMIPETYDNEICSTGFCVLRANTEIVLPKWIYHNIATTDFFAYVEQNQKGASYPAISDASVKAFSLPVPPLEVQREIVHILDSFTLLTAELTAELTARKKQYEFYRDNLIKKEQHISEVKKLADVANIYDSLHQTPSYSNSGYSMVRVQDIKGGYVDEDKTLKVDESVWNLFTQKYTPRLNDIVVSRVGSYGNFALIPNDKCCLGQNVALIHPNINPKYLYHVLMSTMTKQWINNNVKGASQKSFSLADIKRVPVPVPKENIQQRIAEVLDNFEAICTDLNIGLPAEIEARQKQYEYYRDLLLTFAETGSTLMTDRQTDRQS